MGGYKVYQEPLWFTCCVGTGMENHSKYSRNIYFFNDRELYVSQFIASELYWQEKGLTLRQLTRYPEEQGTTFEFDCRQPMALVVEYWGGFPGSKTFDILVDGQKIATENISGKKEGQFIDVRYDIPDKLTFGKRKITVKFAAHPGHMAGPVFEIRIIKR